MPTPDVKKIFFASDFHLQDTEYTRERLQYILDWLDSIAEQARAIFLLGDVFDYWFEYKHVVPRGFNKFIAKLQELKDQQVEIYILGGNHDIWIGKYFSDELGLNLLYSGDIVELMGKKFYLHHGDALGKNNKLARLLKKVFKNPLCIWLFSLQHPNIGITIMKYFSRKSRENENHFATLNPVDKWPTYVDSIDASNNHTLDYCVYGHMHESAQRTIPNTNCVYINLGEWITQRSYGVFDGIDFRLQFFKNDQGFVHI